MAVSSDTAVLRVAVTTALGAQPLENALVTVSTAPDESGYTVEAALEGYVPLTALHIALFSGVPALLPVALTPLPEYESTAPAELTSDGQTQVLSSERE